ncbi:MAG: sigma-70 family RNA polymerase sigma factor [Verrucomicrobia subdivision 3 bacterium]|nr:sigma-70 family RNA polymerase sigma factor [Limisphaerales bacterium]
MAKPIQPALDTRACFQETHWSVVLAARETDSSRAEAALEALCRTYWPPLYAFIRRDGHSPEEAQDLTQEFFARFLKRNGLATISPDKGRFRSFLLAVLKHFLINEWRREQRQKRGGGCLTISLDAEPIEARYQTELVATATPESAFERHWAFTVLDQTMNRLREEYARSGKSDLFDLLQETLSGQKRSTPRAQIAARCGISVGAVDVAVHRLRRRYGELLREEIAHTVNEPDEVEAEIRHLKAVLGRS